MKQITQEAIARAAGVSRSTVSRALRNDPRLPTETCQRIQDLAGELGYKPNPLVSALMASRNPPRSSVEPTTIAIVITWEPGSQDTRSETFQRILSGAEERADSLGFKTEQFWLHADGMSDARLDEILRSRGISSLLFAPFPLEHPKVEFSWDRYCLGAICRNMQLPAISYSAASSFFSMTEALKMLQKKGYRRPGLVLPMKTPGHVSAQWVGALAAAEFNNLNFRYQVPPLVYNGIEKDAIESWHASHKPDILVSNDWGLTSLLKETRLGERFPHIMLDRLPNMNHLAGVDQLHQVVGAAGVDIVVAQAMKNVRGVPKHPKHVLIEGIWREGASCPTKSQELQSNFMH